MSKNKISPQIKINLETYRDKVLGCWTGKNIGGTLGAPFEWDNKVNNVTFYTQELGGKPEPNDDLDLQLIWLLAAEEKGTYNLNERILGEYWLDYIVGPWNEYAVCKANMRNGLYPPLSGSCNNDKWKNSNGAWIRSEIWACIFPGSPDEAAQFAYYDSCCDHSGDGIYAEIFTAVLESAAFIISDVRELIELGLSKIPADCRVAQSIRLACEHYDKGSDFLTVREAVVKDSEDMGWFQAPVNLGFMIIGLLYGEGDFGKSICLATNCGDDTDCTAGTVGSILGIIYGRSAIPKKWTEPIGESIQTCSLVTYSSDYFMQQPTSLNELTDRVIKLAISTQRENPGLPLISIEKSIIPDEYIKQLSRSDKIFKRILTKSPYKLTFDLPYGQFSVDYDQGVEVVPGEAKKLTLRMENLRCIENLVSVKLLLPEDWQIQPSAECRFMIQRPNISGIEVTVTPGEFDESYYYMPVEIRISNRFHPIVVHVPLQRKGSVNYDLAELHEEGFDLLSRRKSRNQAKVNC